jgi:hypothetical protein
LSTAKAGEHYGEKTNKLAIFHSVSFYITILDSDPSLDYVVAE